MKTRHRLGIALLGAWLALSAGAGAAAPVRLATASGDPREAVGRPALTVTPFGGTIDVAVTGSEESDPAVAVCASNQYLAVYERGADIYGQRLTSVGDLLGDAFLISDGAKPASRPDVACEWTNDYFVVVWESEWTVGDNDIRAQAVYGEHQGGGQLLGSWIFVALSSIADERNPAVACNSDDQTCLVAYESESGGDSNIHGRRVEVSGPGITVPQASFEISGATAESNPDLAWSHAASNFFVVWEHWFENFDPPSHYVLTYRRMHDTHQPVNQWQEPAYGLIRGTCGGYNNHQESPAVAYSRGAGEYLVAYQYDRDALGDYDIAASRVLPDVANWPDCPFFVAETGLPETDPAAAYSGGPEHFSDKHGNPQFLVTYGSDEFGEMAIYAQAVKDRDDGSGVHLDGDARELDRVPSAIGGVAATGVTGSAHNGRYLTVWERTTTGASPDRDVLGRIVAPYGGVFSIAGTSFVPADSASSYTYEAWGGVRLTAVSPRDHMFASVELPEGVTITSLTLYYQDNHPNEDIRLDLMRYTRTGGNTVMASVASANDGTSSKTDDTPLTFAVDNVDYDYALVAEMPVPDLTLYGAKITYIPNVTAAIGPFSTASSPPASEGMVEASTGALGEEGPVLRAGGRVVPLAAPSPAGREARRAEGGLSGNGPRLETELAPSAGVAAPGGLQPLDWKRYTVAGADFHPTYSDTDHVWSAGGGRYVTAAAAQPSLGTPLSLIHGKTIHQARFTYYDNSAENPVLLLYRVDRQGNGSFIWNFIPDASGGYFTAISPRLGLAVDNQNFAYYFIAGLHASAGSDLQAMEIEISYVADVYLPLVLKQSATLTAPEQTSEGETGVPSAVSLGYLSIAGATFVPNTSGTVYQTDTAGGVAVTGVSDVIMHAPLLLPDGALLQGFRFYYYDNHASHMTAALKRNNHPHVGSGQELATVQSSGAAGYGDAYVSVGTPIVIDNRSYNYEVEVVSLGATTDLRLMGVRIYYSTP